MHVYNIICSYIYPENVKLIVVNLKEDVVKIFFLP